MTHKLRYLFLLLFLGISSSVFAQSGGVAGTVVDEKGEPMIGAIVQVFQGGIAKGGAQTDYDGKYSIKPLSAGENYEIRVKYSSYVESRVKNVRVSPDRLTSQDFKMELSTTTLKEFKVVSYKIPLINREEPGTTTTYGSKQIEALPTHNTTDVASLAGGTYQSKSGAGLNIAGARTNGTLYIVDGVQVSGSGSPNFPPGSVDQLSVLTSGLPAKYGDATGGVVEVTTKGQSEKTQGSVGFEHSVDGYNHNLAYFNLSGPLLKKKIDSVNKKNILGYSLSGQYLYDQDNNPNYFNNYTVKADVLKQLQDNPLVLKNTSNGTVYRYASEYITDKDLETSKKRINADSKNARIVGKLDYQLSDNANVQVGGNFTYTDSKNYNASYSLFASSSMPENIAYNGRAFVRLTQKLGKSNSFDVAEEGKTKERPLISNAFYSIQADYQVDNTSQQDAAHKHNAFEYGYVGKFDVLTSPFYASSTDSITGKTGIRLVTYDNPVGVLFTPSSINPILANYTSEYYRDNTPITLQNIQQANALRNGDLPAATYSLYQNVGYAYPGYYYTNSQQYAFNVDAQFDLQPKKTKHSIEFGMYYQQRTERSYSLNASSLWNIARLLVNNHLTGLDLKNPIWVINGQQYTQSQLDSAHIIAGPNDTIIYNRQIDLANQSTFDKNLRKSLGFDVNGDHIINIEALDPSQMSVNMFSANEILNNGSPVATYYGYDYTGKRLDGQINFNDWFTKKDANGNYLRQIGAYRPNYTYGFIQDRFELPNKTLFNIGARIERFDANTKVLKDPYSLYAENTVGTSDAINNINGGKTPSNIGSNYVVYVSDNTTTAPNVIGYRNGDDWYDAQGNFIQDPTILKTLYGISTIEPYLQKTGTNRALTMKDAGYDPNTSFTDYTPQVSVMPRINFTFPIADQSMFYAHYDIVVQRPKSANEVLASPADYYYINQNSNSIIANPNLKPEKLFDYELGFQQALSTNSAVTISGFYKERKDMIQVRPYILAYPNTYFTYGNRDYSTTKGFVLKYDLRRINHLALQLSYTLQFAEGTGSSSTSSNGGNNQTAQGGLLSNLIAAQLPNLRFEFPLDYDSRHSIAANLDYRYDDGEGPIVGGKHILQNAGINFVFRARSGEPYTRYAQANTSVVIGGVQGSRLPWHYMMDFRIDKDFSLSFAKKNVEGRTKASHLGLTAFVYISNLLSTKDILGVYGYTGRPDDDGYIASPQGQVDASVRTNTQSYSDLYNLSRQNAGYLNNPRRINLGVSLNF